MSNSTYSRVFCDFYEPNTIKIYDLVPVPHSEAEDGGHASITPVGCVVNADWTGNAAAGLCFAAHSDKKKARTKAQLILSLFIYLPLLAKMTQYLS